MFIAVTLKRYRAVKEVGKIKMSVGIIAYYQLMQVCQVKIPFLTHFVLFYRLSILPLFLVYRVCNMFLGFSMSCLVPSVSDYDISKQYCLV